MRPGPRWRRPAACALVIAFTTGCASAPPTPVTSIEPLVPLVRWLNQALGYPPAKARR